MSILPISISKAALLVIFIKGINLDISIFTKVYITGSINININTSTNTNVKTTGNTNASTHTNTNTKWLQVSGA